MDRIDFRTWERIFASRGEELRSFEWIPFGPRDRSPEVITALRLAAHWEHLGAGVLLRAARQAEDPVTAQCIERQALEEEMHAGIMRQLLQGEPPLAPMAPIRWAEWLVTRPMPLVEQMLATLVIESWGSGIYATIIDAIGPGRVAVAMQQIVDDERLHFDFTQDFLIGVVPTLPRHRVRSLRRLRSWSIGALLAGTAIGFYHLMRPITQASVRDVRRRVLSEIERALSPISELAITPGAG